MEYRISVINDSILIKVLGPFSKYAIYSAKTLLKPILKNVSKKIILDISDLKNIKEMVFHLGLVNAFKKEIDQAGGKLFIKTDEPVVHKYLQKTGLDRIFNSAGGQLLN
jgi:anti-anti-sigma regulatory factor